MKIQIIIIALALSTYFTPYQREVIRNWQAGYPSGKDYARAFDVRLTIPYPATCENLYVGLDIKAEGYRQVWTEKNVRRVDDHIIVSSVAVYQRMPAPIAPPIDCNCVELQNVIHLLLKGLEQ